MRTWIEINGDFLKNNLNVLASIARQRTVGFVLKSNAYGHGMSLLAKYFEKNIDKKHYICVSHVDEVVDVRASGWTGKILVMGYANEIIQDDPAVYYAIYSYEYAEYLLSKVEKTSLTLKVHLKVETGMRRLGMVEDEFEKTCQFLVQSAKRVSVIGLMSHCFDSASYSIEYPRMQEKLFKKYCCIAEKYFSGLLRHIFATGTCSIENDHEMIRAGSAIYGLYKSDNHKKRLLENFPEALYKQVMTWKTKVVQVKTVPAGSYVGYGTETLVNQETKIAILPVGYSEGYPRSLSYSGGVLIRGIYAPFCGVISMNLMTVDVSHIVDVSVGDEVLLTSSDDLISLATLGKKSSMPSITLSSLISPKITRILRESDVVSDSLFPLYCHQPMEDSRVIC